MQFAIDTSRASGYALDDTLDSIRGPTDGRGALIGLVDYDAFGASRSQSGSSLPLGFTGELTDPTTGFLDLRARDLDPALGRFLSCDTVSPNAPGTQGYNPYAYVANNPTTWIDPSGHDVAAENFVAPPLTNRMVASAAMQIAFRAAAKLIAVVCATARGCTLGGVLLLFAAGVLGCILDLGSACWTNAVGNATAVLHYGSTAAAGAWTLSGPATRFGWQHFPGLPTGPVCALGAAEGIASNAVVSALGGNHSSASDTTLAAAMGCASGGSSGGSGGGADDSATVTKLRSFLKGLNDRNFDRFLESLEQKASRHGEATRSIAETRVILDEAIERGWTIEAHGIADDWVGGRHIDLFNPSQLKRIHFPIPEGMNP